MDAKCECKQEAKIAMLEQRDGMILDLLGKLEQKTDLILMQITKVAVLEVNHDHQSEALARAFTRIEHLERATADAAKESSRQIEALSTETRKFMNQMEGMARGAKILWTLMGGGLGLMFLKIVFAS
jgi:hypothetical protein